MNGSDEVRESYLDSLSAINKKRRKGEHRREEGKKNIFTKKYCLLCIQLLLNSLAENI